MTTDHVFVDLIPSALIRQIRDYPRSILWTRDLVFFLDAAVFALAAGGAQGAQRA
jgi:hypothetical protein